MELARAWWLVVQARRQTGQGLLEYALILSLVSIAAVAIMIAFGTTVSSMYSTTQAQMFGP